MRKVIGFILIAGIAITSIAFVAAGLTTFTDPVRFDCNASPGLSQGCLGIGNEGLIDGDAIVHLKHLFNWTGVVPPNGVGNIHGIFNGPSAAFYTPFSNQFIAAYNTAVIRSTSRANVTGTVYGAQCEVFLEAGAEGRLERVHSCNADFTPLSSVVSIGEYTSYYARYPGYASNVDNVRGLFIERLHGRISSRAIVLQGTELANGIQFGEGGPTLYSSNGVIYIDGQRIVTSP